MSYYITTPIYYVNGTPHIGHAYTTTAADTATRYQRLKGRQAYFLTGTDEHGQKVLEAAQKRGMSPKAHCDDIVGVWKQMMADLDIGYDRFIRTTDADHQAVVQAVLQHLYDRGEIYLDSYTGWYSTAAERFWTEKELVDGKCPDTGQPVQQITESNYFFRMGKYRDRLVEHIQAHPEFLQPESRRNEVLGFLRQELGDLCISRPKARMSWGIEIPFDREYVTYVWFDALLNYLTGAGYTPASVAGRDTAYLDRWPANFHLVGKDILTTHAVYWSTMLMALEVPLFTTLFAHGWWTATDGQKMSKSLGNVIDVGLLSRSFGVDAVRYFLLREIKFGADGGFSYDGFLTRYNAELANDFGNLVHRGLTMSTNWLGGRVPAVGRREPADQALVDLATRVVLTFDEALEGLKFQTGFEAVMELVGATNKYVDDQKPWALNKAGQQERLATVLRVVLEVNFVVGALMSVVMPRKGAELLGRLGRSVDDVAPWLASALASRSVGLDALQEGSAFSIGDPLFPRHREMPEEIAALLAAAPDAAPAAPAAKAPAAKAPATPATPVSPKAPAPEAAQETFVPDDGLIDYEHFQKIQLRAGKILAAENHPSADRLLVLKVDVGEPEPRTIVAGIKSKFAAEDLPGRSCVVVINLKPAKLRGVESHGMLLAAGGPAVVDLVSVAADPGTIVR